MITRWKELISCPISTQSQKRHLGHSEMCFSFSLFSFCPIFWAPWVGHWWHMSCNPVLEDWDMRTDPDSQIHIQFFFNIFPLPKVFQWPITPVPSLAPRKTIASLRTFKKSKHWMLSGGKCWVVLTVQRGCRWFILGPHYALWALSRDEDKHNPLLHMHFPNKALHRDRAITEYLSFFFFPPLWGCGLNSSFALAKQALYHLSDTSVYFALVILEMGSLGVFAWASLKP
jgi:hypothetical protein